MSQLPVSEPGRAETEELYRALLASSPIGLYIAQKGQFYLVNRRFCEYTGFSQDELLGSETLSLVHPEDRAEVSQSAVAMLKGHRRQPYEFRVITKSGETIWIVESVVSIIFEGKRAVLGNFIDITERKRAGEVLRESAERYHSLFENMLNGYAFCKMLFDEENKPVDFIYIDVNAAFEKLTGLSKADVIGKRVTEAIPSIKALNPEIIPIYGEVVLTGKPTAFEVFFKPLDSWLTISAYRPQKDHFVAVFDNITERKRAEEKIRRLYSLLFAIRKINQSLLRVESELELFQEACNFLVEVDYIKFAWVGLVETGSYEVKPVAHAGYKDGYLSAIRVAWDDSDYGRGPIGTAIKTGHPFIIRDIASDTRFQPWRKEALERGYASMVAMPLVDENETIGVLNVYSAATDAFGAEEAGFIAEVAGDITMGIKTLRLQESLKQSLQNLHQALNGTVESISALCEIRDPYTAGHESAVAHLACAIATEMGLPAEQIQGLWMAASIHDMGKIAIPAEILSKPHLLADYEETIIRRHPEVAYDILNNLQFPWPVAQAVLQHHERLDGSGYPAGLSGEQIILEARILGVADIVEAMSSHRPYRPALGTDRALLELLRNKGTLYDPQVADACVRLFSDKGFKLGPEPKQIGFPH